MDCLSKPLYRVLNLSIIYAMSDVSFLNVYVVSFLGVYVSTIYLKFNYLLVLILFLKNMT